MNGLLSKGGLAGLFALVFSCGSVAEVVLVGPGDQTLHSAVAGAANGDVLELVTGAYTGPALTVDKSLTVRAQTSAETPTVALTSTLSLVGLALEQTWQGITFDGMTISMGGSSAQYTFQGCTFNSLLISGAANANMLAIRVIESSFNESTMGCQGCSQETTVIGSTLVHSAAATVIDLQPTSTSYFAGNSITTVSPGVLRIIGLESHIIGNQFTVAETTGDVLVSGPTGQLYMIGNRFDVRFDTSFGDIVATPKIIHVIQGTAAQIRNNLIEITDTSALSTGVAGSRVTGINGIYLNLSANGIAEISNNIIDYGNFDLGIESSATNGAIHLLDPAIVQNNIFFGIDRPHFTFDAGTVSSNIFRHNLCFNTVNPCTNLDGNQDADPLFVDTVDYMLGGGSPAIDAGPDTATVLDADGTRADLGIHGGQYPIDQFDLQRTPGRTAPFIYPLFNATSDIDNAGNVQIEVIGAARYR